jgi:peptide-methionine (S)-S-oxide reductase
MIKAILGLAAALALVLPLRARAAEAPIPQATAIFAGGCFWCVEEAFDAVDGVLATTSGYIGGLKPRPTYEQVSAGGTGHAEAVQVVYDPAKVSYEKLLDVFWRNIDPVQKDAQFCDHGDQYRSAVFYLNDEQKRLAEAAKAALEKSDRLKAPIATQIVPATPFYKAEDYHQDYHQRNPLRYKFYKYQCGRAQRLKELWGE